VLNATFTAPDLDTFSQLDRLGLTVTGQLIEPHRSVLECRVLEPDNWCHGCGQQGASRGTVIRRLAHVPLGWRPTTLQVRVRRYRCPDCRSVWRQDTSTAAEPRAVL
jgi:transposase